MSRSYKKNVAKIGADGSEKRSIRRQVRRAIKNSLNSQDIDENLILPNPKTIVNDYDVLDWRGYSDDITRK